MLEVIGAGFGRTGTHSLARALEILGISPCYTILEVARNPGHRALWEQAISGKPVDWQHIYRDYRAAVEWPTVTFLPELLEVFPKAKVILTLRDPEAWYESAASTIFPGLAVASKHPDAAKRKVNAWKRKLILGDTFENKYEDKRHTIAIYNRHIAKVKTSVPAESLLQFHVREGWGPLCNFLNVPPPDIAFPHKNERQAFLDSAPKWAKDILDSRVNPGKD